MQFYRSYFFGGFIFNSSILVFIIVIILSALDFWTVKNVTGRLLVGLRWWSDYDEKGNEVWKFESYDKEFKANAVDTTFFWTSQIAFTGFWAVMFVIKLLSLSFYWVLLVSICLALGFTNLLGYYKCRGGTTYSNVRLQQEAWQHEGQDKTGRLNAFGKKHVLIYETHAIIVWTCANYHILFDCSMIEPHRKSVRLLSSLRDLKLGSNGKPAYEVQPHAIQNKMRSIKKIMAIKKQDDDDTIYENFTRLERKPTANDYKLIRQCLSTHFVFSSIVKDPQITDFLLKNFFCC